MSKSSSAPPSWPSPGQRSTFIEQSKPQSASPPKNRITSKMKRFQKATAIYTLPIREKKRFAVQSLTGE